MARGRGRPPAPGQGGDLRVDGADRFAALGARLRASGQGELLKELQRALQQASKPLTPASRARARQVLPSRGGLGALVARAPQRITARAGSSKAAVKFTIGKKGSGARGAEIGVVRHPTFGNRRAFVSQRVTPGWFSATAQAERGEVRDGIREVLDEFTERLAREV